MIIISLNQISSKIFLKNFKSETNFSIKVVLAIKFKRLAALKLEN